MQLVYVTDTDSLAAIMKNGGRVIADQKDAENGHIYTVDVSKVSPTIFMNGQIIKCFSCERPKLTF